MRDLLRAAYHVAAKSKDQSTQVGAIIVKDQQLLLQACNTFVGEEHQERPLKYSFIEHAERYVIYQAAKYGIPLKNTTLICPWASCPDCARGIVLSGITCVIGHQQALDKTPVRWREEVDLGIKIMKKGSVEYILFDGNIGQVQNLFDGELWQP